MINNNPISWSTKKQKSVALSTSEAELYAVVEGTKEVIWIKQFLKELTLAVSTPTLYCDNQSTISISNYNTLHDRSKHINIKHFFIRDEIQNGNMKIEWISTEDQSADIFTKALPRDRYIKMVNQIINNNELMNNKYEMNNK